MTPTPARIVLLRDERRSSVDPAPRVRRVRLARVNPMIAPAFTGERFAHLKRCYD